MLSILHFWKNTMFVKFSYKSVKWIIQRVVNNIFLIKNLFLLNILLTKCYFSICFDILLWQSDIYKCAQILFWPLHDLEVKGRLRRVEQRYWTRLQICWLFDYKPWIAQSQKDRVEKHCLISSPYGHHLTECLGFWNNSNHRSVHCSRQRMHEKNLQCSKAHTHTHTHPQHQ